MYCRKCGSKLPDDSQFCPKCGTPVKSKRSQQEVSVPPVSSRKNKRSSSRSAVKKTKRKTIYAIIAVITAAALVTLTIADPLGIRDVSKKFQKTAESMKNEWRNEDGPLRSKYIHVKNNDNHTVQEVLFKSGLIWKIGDKKYGESYNFYKEINYWDKYQLTEVEYYNVYNKNKKQDIAFFSLFECKDSVSSNSMVNHFASVLTETFKIKKSGNLAWHTDEIQVQICPKDNYVLICKYDNNYSLEAEKFINKVGF